MSYYRYLKTSLKEVFNSTLNLNLKKDIIVYKLFALD